MFPWLVVALVGFVIGVGWLFSIDWQELDARWQVYLLIWIMRVLGWGCLSVGVLGLLATTARVHRGAGGPTEFLPTLLLLLAFPTARRLITRLQTGHFPN